MVSIFSLVLGLPSPPIKIRPDGEAQLECPYLIILIIGKSLVSVVVTIIIVKIKKLTIFLVNFKLSNRHCDTFPNINCDW